jgi:hypothetical protein
LDVVPNGSIVTANFYKTQSDAIEAVTAVYSSLTYESGDLTLYGGVIPYLTDLTSDYLRVGAQASSPHTRTLGTDSYDADNQRIALGWGEIYRGIDRANLAVDNIPSVVAISDALKARLVNEAKFVRALLYFDAVRLWGPVPLVLHEASSLDNSQLYVGRTSVDSVYIQIINDLTSATNLPASYSGADIGRATSGAANALLAKVYLTRGDWTNAIKYARIVENSGYALVTNYYDLYDPLKKNGIEHIFSAQFEMTQGAGGMASGLTVEHCYWSSGFTNSTDPVIIISDTTQFYNIYSNSDQRKKVSYAKNMYDPLTGTAFKFILPRSRKYIDTTIVLTAASSMGNNNFNIIRYSDILLTLAEAINEQTGPNQEALEAINEVRRRAYQYDISTVGSPVDLPSTISQEQFRDSLRLERYKEFTQEGQRWFDLVRWKVLVQSIKKAPAIYKGAISTRNYLFPIPITQLDLDPKLTQNWGYSGASAAVTNPYDSSYK